MQAPLPQLTATRSASLLTEMVFLDPVKLMPCTRRYRLTRSCLICSICVTYRDFDASSWCTERVGVALIDDDTELAYPSCSVARVGDSGNRGVSRACLCLDAKGLVAVDQIQRRTVSKSLSDLIIDLLVSDCVAADGNVRDRSVRRDRADGDTVATDASVALENDVATLVDSKAVILIMDSANTILSMFRMKKSGHVLNTCPRLSNPSC